MLQLEITYFIAVQICRSQQYYYSSQGGPYYDANLYNQYERRQPQEAAKFSQPFRIFNPNQFQWNMAHNQYSNWPSSNGALPQQNTFEWRPEIVQVQSPQPNPQPEPQKPVRLESGIKRRKSEVSIVARPELFSIDLPPTPPTRFLTESEQIRIKEVVEQARLTTLGPRKKKVYFIVLLHI